MDADIAGLVAQFDARPSDSADDDGEGANEEREIPNVVSEVVEEDVDEEVDEEAAGEGQTVGVPTAKSYVAAICKLHSFQVDVEGSKELQHPRTDSVKELLKTLKKVQKQKDKAEFKDRGIGTMENVLPVSA
jgi:hypothetical protein